MNELNSALREALASIPRPYRVVSLPGGGSIPVRQLTLAELRRVDARAEQDVPEDGPERAVRAMVLLVAAAVAGPDGAALLPGEPSAYDLVIVEQLTAEQMKAIAEAATSSREAAKNG